MMCKKQTNKHISLGSILLMGLTTILSLGFSNNTPSPISIHTTQQTDSIYQLPDQMPVFKDGNLFKWINQNTQYPPLAAEQKIQGKVFIKFIVEKDGSMSNFEVTRGVHPLLDEEALKVAKAMPLWTPATVQGNPVRALYTLPVTFRLTSGDKKQDPELFYTDFIKEIDNSVQKLNNPSLLTDIDKSPIGKEWMPNDTDNDQEAYQQILKYKEDYITVMMNEAGSYIRSLNFTPQEERTVIKIYEQFIKNALKQIKDIGPDNFIEKYSALSTFEESTPKLKVAIALKDKLPPERHRQLILFTHYAKPTPPIINRNLQKSGIVEELPVFPLGRHQMWIAKNVRYPKNAVVNNIQGKVYVEFFIEKDGYIREATILRGVSPELDEEALRVVKSMPRWKPATQNGKPVRVRFTTPINFQLAN